MKKKKLISLILTCFLACSLLIPGTSLSAEGETPGEGMVINKTATDNDNGTYTIELEAYATGESIITEETHDVPTDIVLVLDQSGSMDYDFTTTVFNSYGTRTNGYFYDRRHNGGNANLWYQLEDGSYASVSVVREPFTVYSAISGWSNSTYYSNRNNLYQLVDDVYYKVTVTRSGGIFSRKYTYTSAGGLNFTSEGAGNSPENFGGLGPLYRTSGTDYNYTYSYTDAGNTVTIGTSSGVNTNFTDVTLYRRDTSSITRLAALKTAVSNFANSVASKAAGQDGTFGTADDVKHRIAVVGFASQSGYGNNTELLSISGTNSGTVGVAYNNITNQNLIDVVQDMDTSAGRTMVTNAINALAAEGATEIDLGMDMAQDILSANPVPAGEERNRVVVVFTDGSPTRASGFQKAVATSAISISGGIKNGGTTVYSVGIFDGADATSPGTEPPGNLSGTSPDLPAASNWFMQNLSSNYGTPQNPSYYLSAADAETLNSIFQQIAEQIEEGGTSVTLGSETYIRDIIAPSFILPEGTTADDIALETWKYNGPSYDAAGAWTKNTGAMGATAVIGSTNTGDPTTTDNQLSITGFDFSENWAGSVTENGSVSYRGHKLVIKFNVTPRPGFLGGNQVKTNTSAGVYENADATEPVLTFGEPIVDVPISNISITTPSEAKNVYLLQGVPATDLFGGVSVTIGTVSLNLNPDAVNWGLQPWQNEYVDVSVVYKDADNNPIPPEGLQNVTGDTSYSVTVTVEPKASGTVPGTGYTQTGNVTVNVFKPELTFEDGLVYYGANAPTFNDYSASLTDILWKHNGVLSTEVTMIGLAPELFLNYTPEAGKIVGGKVNTKQDIKVSTVVKLGGIEGTDVTGHTTFLHTPCNPPCGWTTPASGGNPAFLLHVKTCSLTLTKTGGNANEPYVFDILKDGSKYTEATIVGNNSVTLYELPVGNYTIAEDEDWSWRFDANNGGTASLSQTSPTGSITCTNTANDNKYWLNGYSDVVTNTAAAAE